MEGVGQRRGSGVEVDVGDGFIAVGAEPAGPDPPAELLAVWTAAGAEVALLAGRAFVDGGVGVWHRGVGWCRAGLAGTPVGLFAGVGAETAASGRGERGGAPATGDHQHIVTPIVTDGWGVGCQAAWVRGWSR